MSFQLSYSGEFFFQVCIFFGLLGYGAVKVLTARVCYIIKYVS
jgi:hypothetical protein